MRPDPARDPAWPALRAGVRAAWERAGSGEVARAALVGAIVEQGCPGAWPGPVAPDRPDLAPALAVPEIAGLVLEVLIAPDDRRARGAHHTPMPVATRLVELAVAGWSGRGRSGAAGSAPAVLDPAVGGGAFLLAAAHVLAAAGHPPAAVLAALHGRDTDPVAVATTVAALRWWAVAAGAPAGGVAGVGVAERVVVGDGLDVAAGEPRFDLVVGNPPFLSQLGATTARDETARARAVAAFGSGVYADTAGLFLVAATEVTRPGGRIVLVQPESFLAARDAGPLRRRLLQVARLTDLWVAVDRVFGAGVRVCAPVCTVGSTGSSDAGPGEVALWRGAGVEPSGRAALPLAAAGWGTLVATVHGTPTADLDPRPGVLGDRATATAGFRDQFYGLVPHVDEAAMPITGAAEPPAGALVTAGAIDPAWCGWGRRAVRFAGRRRLRPAVDLAGLAGDDPALARWVAGRLVPKVLVATQTRVVEAVADPAGRLVPSVPVIAVTPRPDDDPDDDADGGEADPDAVWALAAVLLAPPVSAWALHRAGGAALAADAVKLSASQVLAIPLPVDRVRWDAAAALLRAGGHPASAFGTTMVAAYGLAPDHPVLAWWLARLPSWEGGPVG